MKTKVSETLLNQLNNLGFEKGMAALGLIFAQIAPLGFPIFEWIVSGSKKSLGAVFFEVTHSHQVSMIYIWVFASLGFTILGWICGKLLKKIYEFNDFKHQTKLMALFELRVPVATIKNFNDALRKDSQFKNKISVLEKIDEWTQNCFVILNDLSGSKNLNFDLNLKTKNTDLTKFIKKVSEDNRFLADSHKIQLDVVLPASDELEAPIDLSKMEQALNGLLSNSFRNSRQNTVTTLSLRFDQAQAVVSITDEGQGLSEEQIKAIVNEQKEVSAIGPLGIIIAKKVIEGHGGTFEIESKPGSGSKFVISLPARQLRKSISFKDPEKMSA